MGTGFVFALYLRQDATISPIIARAVYFANHIPSFEFRQPLMNDGRDPLEQCYHYYVRGQVSLGLRDMKTTHSRQFSIIWMQGMLI